MPNVNAAYSSFLHDLSPGEKLSLVYQIMAWLGCNEYDIYSDIEALDNFVH